MRRFLITTAVAGMAIASTLFGAAPEAAARPDPGGVRSCASGSLAVSATKTFAGAAAPGGSGPAKSPSEAGRIQGGRNTGDVGLNGELVGRGCYKRSGGTATMQFRWSSIGRIQSGTFIYQLFDCKTGRTSKALTRRMDYETGTRGTSDEAEATLKVNPAHKYRMRISGGGSYERGSDGFSGVVGYWSIAPGVSQKWFGETTCA